MALDILTAAALMLVMTLLIGSLLGMVAESLPDRGEAAVDIINRVLPQIQCAQCGYPGCRPYAQAINRGEAINRCPPGADTTIRALSELLGRPAMPLDPALALADTNRRAVIRETECIGCTLCIKACPVDAIVGAAGFMHTVISAQCTGCDLCVAPCPVDCIDMVRP